MIATNIRTIEENAENKLSERIVQGSVCVTPRSTDSTGEFENPPDESEELCYSSLFPRFMKHLSGVISSNA